jgi:plastocyanin
LTSGTNQHGVSVIRPMRIPTKQRAGRALSVALSSALGALVIALMPPLGAAELNISVVDAAGHGVAGVVLVAEPEVPLPPAKHPPRTTIMDQQNMQFVPNIVVIQSGGGVEFPNSDQIEHQVYSFSAAKSFQLSLYAGHKYPPVVFDRPGLVVVGCNIHDHMIGYIYVADSPWFGRSNDSGQLALHDLPAGNYRLTAWHPRLQEAAGPTLQMPQVVSDGSANAATFHLTHPLKPSTEHSADKRWADY